MASPNPSRGNEDNDDHDDDKSKVEVDVGLPVIKEGVGPPYLFGRVVKTHSASGRATIHYDDNTVASMEEAECKGAHVAYKNSLYVLHPLYGPTGRRQVPYEMSSVLFSEQSIRIYKFKVDVRTSTISNAGEGLFLELLQVMELAFASLSTKKKRKTMDNDIEDYNKLLSKLHDVEEEYDELDDEHQERERLTKIVEDWKKDFHDVSERPDVEFSVNQCMALGPYVPADFENDCVLLETTHTIKNYLYSGKPAEYAITFDKSSPTKNDIHDDVTGEIRKELQDEPAPRVNETLHGLQQNMFIWHVNGKPLFVVAPREPLRCGSSVELLTKYSSRYEPIRREKGYSQDPLAESKKLTEDDKLKIVVDCILGLQEDELSQALRHISSKICKPIDQLLSTWMKDESSPKPTLSQLVARDRAALLSEWIQRHHDRVSKSLSPAALEQNQLLAKEMNWMFCEEFLEILRHRDIQLYDKFMEKSRQDASSAEQVVHRVARFGKNASMSQDDGETKRLDEPGGVDGTNVLEETVDDEQISLSDALTRIESLQGTIESLRAELASRREIVDEPPPLEQESPPPASLDDSFPVHAEDDSLPTATLQLDLSPSSQQDSSVESSLEDGSSSPASSGSGVIHVSTGDPCAVDLTGSSRNDASSSESDQRPPPGAFQNDESESIQRNENPVCDQEVPRLSEPVTLVAVEPQQQHLRPQQPESGPIKHSIVESAKFAAASSPHAHAHVSVHLQQHNHPYGPYSQQHHHHPQQHAPPQQHYPQDHQQQQQYVYPPTVLQGRTVNECHPYFGVPVMPQQQQQQVHYGYGAPPAHMQQHGMPLPNDTYGQHGCPPPHQVPMVDTHHRQQRSNEPYHNNYDLQRDYRQDETSDGSLRVSTQRSVASSAQASRGDFTSILESIKPTGSQKDDYRYFQIERNRSQALLDLQDSKRNSNHLLEMVASAKEMHRSIDEEIEATKMVVVKAKNLQDAAEVSQDELSFFFAEVNRILNAGRIPFHEHTIATLTARCSSANFKDWPLNELAQHFGLDNIQCLEVTSKPVLRTFLTLAYNNGQGLSKNTAWETHMKNLEKEGYLHNVSPAQFLYGRNLSSNFVRVYIGLVLDLVGAKESRPSANHKLEFTRNGERANVSPWIIPPS